MVILKLAVLAATLALALELLALFSYLWGRGAVSLHEYNKPVLAFELAFSFALLVVSIFLIRRIFHPKETKE